MEFSSSLPESQSHLNRAPTLQVNFSYAKFKACVTELDKPSTPIYTIDFATFKAPHMTVKSASDHAIVGTGTLHPISINADYELHGQKGTLKALKRFKTSYTHLSYAFSETDAPVPMTWTSSCGFKTWDFVCLDPEQNAVAKFSSNAWAVKKLGAIEFLGPKATSAAVRDEIVVTGLTLFYCMTLRSNNVLSLFGAIFAKPGPIEQKAPVNEQQKGLEDGVVR